MNRSAGFMVLCVALGATAMYGVSNFRVRVESVAAEPPVTRPSLFAESSPLPAPATQTDPARLPESVTAPKTAQALPTPVSQPEPVVVRQVVALQASPKAISFRHVDDGGLRWDAGANSALTVSCKSFKPKLVFNRAIKSPEKLVVSLVGGDPVPAANDKLPDGVNFTDNSTDVEFDLEKLAPRAGVVQVQVEVRTERDERLTSTPSITLRKPTSESTADVTVIGYKDSPHRAGPTPLSGAKQTLPVFSPYFHLSGKALGNPAGVRFVLKTADNKAEEVDFRNNTVRPTQTGDWEAELRLPFVLTGNAEIYVRAEYASGHLYSAPVSIAFQSGLGDNLPAPEFVSLKLKEEDTKGLTATSESTSSDLRAYRTNTRTVFLTVKAPNQSQGVILYRNSAVADPQLYTPLAPSKAGDPIVIPITLRDERGDHLIKVAGVQGESVGQFSQFKIQFEDRKPSVEGVSAPGFGKSGGVGTETIQVRFNTSNRLDRESATDPANYIVFHEQAATATDKDLKAVPDLLAAGQPAFDPTTNTVTLTVQSIKPGSYRVAVLQKGKQKSANHTATGIKDEYGNELAPLSGLNRSEAAFEAVVYTEQGGNVPPQTAGVTGTTGPAVTYPIYVKPPTYPDGANPGDRVETRVVRLYYYRDAHRVAQLVNRTVKSYNAATVEVRKRAADAARDRADETTIDRKTLELTAVKAAQDARAAEAQLQTLLERMTSVRVESANARVQFAQKKVELEQALRDRDRGVIGVAALSSADAVLVQQQVIDQQTIQIARLDAQIKANESTKELDLKTLEARQPDLEQKVDTAQTAVNQAARANTDVPAQQKRMAGIETEIASLKKQKSKVQLDEQTFRAEKTAERKTTEDKRAEENRQLAPLKQTAADKKAEVDRVKQAIGVLDERIKTLEDSINSPAPAGEKALWQKELDSKKPQRTAEQTKLDGKPGEVGLAKQYEVAQAAVNLKQNEIDKLDADIRKIDSELSASTIREQKLAGTAGAPGTLQTQIEARTTDLELERQELTRVEAALRTLEKNREALADAIRDRNEGRLKIATKTAALAQQPELTNQKAIADRQLILERQKLERLRVETTTRADVGVDPARQRLELLQKDINNLQGVIDRAETEERATQTAISAAQSRVANARVTEGSTFEAWQVRQLQERRDRVREFQAGVAALREDPDTYGPGNPDSNDPVLQTSISVIGEGLIKLRGPVKGLNIIRTMVNQIDAPVGQVRIGVHTLQVNGERGDRMEKVIANIQRHLDHSRFLTTQSANMLRKAVVMVASRKAEMAAAEFGPACTQEARDQKYLYSFFGKDFTDELTQLDSEFLKTGNKVLGLHSMDSTSLAAALFVLALAKNDVRAEVLREFQAMLQSELPKDEWSYYLAGLVPGNKCEAVCDKKFYLLSQNARFVSFLGFFNAEVTGTDTMNPAQREFVRLAQIFKARMITEIQLKQRVVERTLLEERIGQSYREKLEQARVLEEAANAALAEARDASERVQLAIVTQFQALFSALATVERQFAAFDTDGLLTIFQGAVQKGATAEFTPTQEIPAFQNQQFRYKLAFRINDKGQRDVHFTLDENSRKLLVDRAHMINGILTDFAFFDNLKPDSDEVKKLLARVVANGELTFFLSELEEFTRAINRLRSGAATAVSDARRQVDQLGELLQSGDEKSANLAVERYNALRADLLRRIRAEARGIGANNGRAAFAAIDQHLGTMLQANFRRSTALKRAQEARRPLDEKKLLDMLVDDMEEKFIELMEGTRAHTANVDNYLKAVATALDDDFNTQFYNPSFRRAREASRYWDVTLSQIETTNVLANNRSFAKVSPAATFEFDLPKRSIMIKEGFASAKAMMSEYGALLADPTFISLAKISSGNPVSMISGGGGGLSSVRGLLPSLPSSTDEMVLAQAGGNKPREVGSALESLIPDPAIYKLETGTGFEIRPVLSPDGQAVVFNFNYMYTTNLREPVRADEKHLGRVDRHFVNTDVNLSNYELREVSKYHVSAKLSRTGKGVPLLQDIPGLGQLFRPLPSAGSSLQQNLIYAQSTIFPTLFDLMGLRYAPAVADLDPLADRLAEFAARNRGAFLSQWIFSRTAGRVDDTLRIPIGERRRDLYHAPITIPHGHPNGFTGSSPLLRDGELQEGHDPVRSFPPTQFAPGTSREGEMKPLPGLTLPRTGPDGFAPGSGEFPLPGSHQFPGGVGQGTRNPAPLGAPPPRGFANGPNGVSGPSGYSTPGGTAVREMPHVSLPPVITPAPATAFPASRPGGSGGLPPRTAVPGLPTLTPPAPLGTPTPLGSLPVGQR